MRIEALEHQEPWIGLAVTSRLDAQRRRFVLGPTLVPRAVARLQSRFPRLRVNVEVGVNSVILPKLFAGDLDLVMSALPEASELPAGIEMQDFGKFHLRRVAGRDHPLHRQRRVTMADLPRYSWVLYRHDQDTLNKLTRVTRAGAGSLRARA